MPDHEANPATGEIIDVSALSDRALQEAVYHQNNDILAALVDVLKAEHTNQGIMSEVLKAAKGEHKQDGTSMKDDMKDFQDSIRAIAATNAELVGAVKLVPAQTGDIVDGRLEATLLRVVGDGGAQVQ